MSREWKPGDVAMVRLDPETEIRVMHNGAGWTGRKGAFYDLHGSARPLVVIDLSEQPVEGDLPGRNESQLLISMLRETAENFFTPDAATLALKVADQIEAQTTPPRPEEPTGLGAVVEDADGTRWVRVDDPHHSWVRSLRDEGAYTQRSKWEYLAAVRVLSEGVTS